MGLQLNCCDLIPLDLNQIDKEIGIGIFNLLSYNVKEYISHIIFFMNLIAH